MKIIVILPFLIFYFSCKQQTSVPPGTDQFESKFVKVLPDTTRMMLIEKVLISYGDLYAEADSALLEKPKQLVTVFGAKKIRFQGKEIDPGPGNDTIVYDKGEGTLISN